jgi:hypothetical protein
VFTPAASVCELNRQILIVSKALMLSIGYPIGFNVVNHGVGNRYAKQMPARLREKYVSSNFIANRVPRRTASCRLVTPSPVGFRPMRQKYLRAK